MEFTEPGSQSDESPEETQSGTPPPENSRRSKLTGRKKPAKPRKKPAKPRTARKTATSRKQPGEPKGPGGRISKAEKARTWLYQAEAEWVTKGLQILFAARYGMATMPPDKEQTKHLASVLRRLEKVFPPFALLQRLLAKVIPLANPDAKPGGSLAGDLAHYTHAWHDKNPHLFRTVYQREEKIPEVSFWPKNPPQTHNQGNGRVTLRRPIQPEEMRTT